MRSPSEIKFRLRQEVANIFLFLRQPKLAGNGKDKLDLPDPVVTAEALRGTPYAQEIEKLADKILEHEFPILGLEIEIADEIRWRRDYIHQKESGTAYFKRIPYLDFSAVGDHKLVWEINRHQHLVLLAQAYLLTRREAFVDEISKQLSSWFSQNVFQRGINWASALEVAFRTLSWIWVYHLVGDHLDAAVLALLTNGLYQHGLHLSENLSIYFSPNTHLLGEAVALFALATLFPSFPRASEWAQRSKRIVTEQSEFQVKADGSHFEQSTYYHVYAVDFFALFYLISGKLPEIEPVLLRMGEYLAWLLGPSREISFFGDDDGGRMFHPYGRRECFGRATLATCGFLLGRPDWVGTADEVAEQAAWWLGKDSLEPSRRGAFGTLRSRAFADSGSVFLSAGEFWLQMDCGPFGFGGAGHSHSDTLSFTLRSRGALVLIDPGTFTYMSDIAERNWFRGSVAHNTVRVDGRDQADSVNPFRWSGKPEVKLLRFDPASEGGLIEAECEYRGIRHRRRVLLNEKGLLVLDVISGIEGEHTCDQIWQLGPKAADFFLSTSAHAIEHPSWFSRAYGQKAEGRCVIATVSGRLPISLAMQLSREDSGSITIETATAAFEAISRISKD